MPQRPDRTEDGSQPSAHARICVADLTDPSGCTLVPNSVLDDDRLGPETRLVYVMLRRLAAAGDGQPVDQRELAGIGVPRSGSGDISCCCGEPDSSTSLGGDPAEPPAAPPRGAPGGSADGYGVDPQVARRLVASYPKEQGIGSRSSHVPARRESGFLRIGQ